MKFFFLFFLFIFLLNVSYCYYSVVMVVLSVEFVMVFIYFFLFFYMLEFFTSGVLLILVSCFFVVEAILALNFLLSNYRFFGVSFFFLW